jgi:hypothetical protein
MQTLLDFMDRMLFTEVSVLQFSLLRVLTGMLLAYESLLWLTAYPQLIAPDGYFGMNEFDRTVRPMRFSILSYMPATRTSVSFICGVQLLSAMTLAIGIQGQLSAWVCLLSTMSIHNRNPHIVDSGDTVRRFLCLFVAVVPNNDAYLSLGSSLQQAPVNATCYSWHYLLLQLFMANIYFKNVLFKLYGDTWRNGTATRNVFHARMWNRFNWPGKIPGPWFPAVTTYGTLVTESWMFVAIWVEGLRTMTIIIGVIFHLLLWAFLRIGFFQASMICGLLALLPEQDCRMILENLVRLFS